MTINIISNTCSEEEESKERTSNAILIIHTKILLFEYNFTVILD